VLQPDLVVLKGGTLLIFAHTLPQTSGQMGDAGKIHVHKNIFLHSPCRSIFVAAQPAEASVPLFKLKADRVIPGISQLGEPIGHAEDEQDDGIISKGNARLAFLDLD